MINTPHTTNPQPAPFETAAQAWLWATEVLRRRRLAPSSPAWRDDIAITSIQRSHMHAELARQNIAQEVEEVAGAWHGRFRNLLPATGAERYALAQAIQTAVLAQPAEASKLLQAWAWGDWADDARLRAALAMQEKARREGLRVRLSYRYSAQQLGIILGCNKVQAWRKLNAALKGLEKTLVMQQIVEGTDVPVSRPATPVRRVEVGVFKGRAA